MHSEDRALDPTPALALAITSANPARLMLEISNATVLVSVRALENNRGQELFGFERFITVPPSCGLLSRVSVSFEYGTMLENANADFRLHKSLLQ
jgi:hypothetical protein